MATTPAAKPAFPAFLDGKPKKLYIDGQWMAAESGELIDTVNPATGEVLASLASGGKADIDRAVRAARKAFEGPWSKWTPQERMKLLLRIADLVEARFDELSLIDTLDMGAPIARTANLKHMVLGAIRFYASQAYNTSGQTIVNSLPGKYQTYTLKAPVGVIGGIVPWNGPPVSQWWVLGPTLATGCTLVLKPAEDASLFALRMAEILEEAGTPPGVVNIVTGYGATAGQALAEHLDVDKIVFTGSTATARKIIQASTTNIKRIQLELGGKSPDIVFADADLDKAVPGAAMAAFGNTGQVCLAGTRLFVQRSIQEEFVERMCAFAKTLKIGPGVDPATQLGPLINRTQLDRVTGYMDIGQNEGARLATGGTRLGGELANGFFVEPTIFADVTNDMRIAQEEIFGPVISMIPFDDINEAVRLGNETAYGLGGAVWTRDLNTALTVTERINAGTLWVNCYAVIDPSVGFGGYKMSGYGWKGGPDHIEGYLYQKVVTINLN